MIIRVPFLRKPNTPTLSQQSFDHAFGVVFCFIAFALIGSYFLFPSHAATFSVASEAEAGTLGGGASVVGDSSASGGEAVKLGSAGTGVGGGSGSGFITASGQKLMLHGKPHEYIGFDAGIAGVCWTTNWTTAQMDTYFSNLPPNGMTRVFTVQSVPATFIESIVTEAAKYNQHLILVLSDDDSWCSDTFDAPTSAEGSGKSAAYYETGWKTNFVNWVNKIVPPLKNNPAVAMWEIANEPFNAGASYAQLGLTTMENYLNGAAAAIRADDPNHLITVGSVDIESYGSLNNYIAAQSGPNIDVLDFHDYDWDFENGATVSINFAQEQQAGKQLNKPYMIDEAGVESGPGCTSSTPDPNTAGNTNNIAGFSSYTGRVTYLMNKANDYLGDGASGIDFWDYELVAGSSCSYEIVPPGDPLIAAVKEYKLPK